MFELGCHVIDLVVGVLGKPTRGDALRPARRRRLDDKLLDNMLAVFDYPRATATVKSSAAGSRGRASAGTWSSAAPRGRSTSSRSTTRRPGWPCRRPRGEYKKGYQDVTFPKYTRYVADAADMARVIRGEKASDFPHEHDLAVQETVLQACGVKGVN